MHFVDNKRYHWNQIDRSYELDYNKEWFFPLCCLDSQPVTGWAFSCAWEAPAIIRELFIRFTLTRNRLMLSLYGKAKVTVLSLNVVSWCCVTLVHDDVTAFVVLGLYDMFIIECTKCHLLFCFVCVMKIQMHILIFFIEHCVLYFYSCLCNLIWFIHCMVTFYQIEFESRKDVTLIS